MEIQNVLHIPTYYSESTEQSLGYAIKEQIDQSNKNNIVLFIEARQESKIIESFIHIEGATKVIHVKHPIGINYFSRTRNYLNAVTTGLSKLIDLGLKIDEVCCYDAGKNLSIALKYFDYIPCSLFEVNNQFLDGGFKEKSKRFQKSILKNINKMNHVWVANLAIKKALLNNDITKSIIILNQ